MNKAFKQNQKESQNIMEDALTSRMASLNILRDIVTLKLPLDMLEKKYTRDLDIREKRLAKAITVTTLRHLGEISFLIDTFMKNPFDDASVEKNIMRIGMAQLLFMDSIPDHAAIHGSVELAKKMKKQRATGIINAILRRTQREGMELLSNEDISELNVPKWLKTKLTECYGQEKRSEIISNMLKGAKLDIRVRDIALTSELEEIAYNVPIHEETFRLRKRSTQPSDIPGWFDGKIYVQDAASQMPARFIKAPIDGPMLDMCSAPGGKTIQLIDNFPDRDVFSTDINPNRLERVRENFERCNVHGKVICMDGSKTAFDNESFASILLDAPCSATGTTRRHPDVLVSRTPEGIEDLKSIQADLLEEAARLLKKGGTLVYSTCSLLYEESEEQISKFLLNHKEFKRDPIQADELGNNESILNSLGELRATPADNLDGFFAARLVKHT